METPAIQMIALAEIEESPFNPRRTYDPAKLQELAESIRTKGVRTPVKVRRGVGRPYQLVYGHRRKRGSEMAGCTVIPALVALDLTDAEAREEQLVENGQREDVHPLEEADAFESTMRLDGLSAKEVADKIGKSESYVHARLKLAKLCEAAREAFLGGKLTPSTALIVARIPNEKLQAKAATEIVKGRFNNDPMSAAEASAHVRRNYMLRLVDAPFDRGDATLCPAAGACNGCPKRTGAQRELFSDVEDKDDLCIDPACWSSKLDARWKREVAAARKSGRPVITDSAEAKKLFPYGDYLAGDGARNYVDLKSTCFDDPKSRTYGALLKKAKPVTTLVRDPQGAIHELVPKKGLEKLLKDAGHDLKKERAEGGRRGETAEEKAERERADAARELRKKVAEAALVKLVGVVEKSWAEPAPWRLAARRLADVDLAAIERRQVDADDLDAYIERLPLPQLVGLVFELAIGTYATYGDNYDRTLIEDCRVLGVDLKQLERELAPPAAPAAPAAAKGKKGKAAAPALEELPPAQAAPAGALAVACPLEMCWAVAGASCTNYKKKPCAPHADRVRAAQKAAAAPAAVPSLTAQVETNIELLPYLARARDQAREDAPRGVKRPVASLIDRVLQLPGHLLPQKERLVAAYDETYAETSADPAPAAAPKKARGKAAAR